MHGRPVPRCIDEMPVAANKSRFDNRARTRCLSPVSGGSGIMRLEVGLSACVVGPKRRVPGDALDYHPATSVRPVRDRDEIFRVELLQAQPIRER